MTTPDLITYATLNGVNLDAGRTINGYELHSDTRAALQQQWRKQSVSNPYVEGEFDVLAVRGNVTETVAVWVYGISASDFRLKTQFLIDAISRPAYSLVWVTGNLSETWDCTFSEYSIDTQAAFQYATMGLVRLSITRRPSVKKVYSDGSVVTS